MVSLMLAAKNVAQTASSTAELDSTALSSRTDPITVAIRTRVAAGRIRRARRA
jgi:hypothetical protein